MGKRKGSGTVVEIKGRFYPRWTVNKERVYGSPFDSWEEADASRVNDRPDTEAPKPISKRNIPTFNEWATVCMNGDYGRRIAKSTWSVQESIRGKHLEPSDLGKTRLHRITENQCKSFLSNMRKGNSEKTVGPDHRNRAQTFLSSLLSLAVKAGLIKFNVLRGAEKDDIEERDNRTLSPEEAIFLLNPKTPLDALMLVAMHTGMRKSELLRLEWRHILKDRNQVMVPGTKSTRSKMVLPLTDEAKEAILAQPKRSIFVFLGEDGGPMKSRRLADEFNRRKVELGIPKETRLQDLRGSYISLLIEAKADIKTVQTLARHGDIRTTMKHYARSRQRVQEAAVKDFQALVTPRKIEPERDEGLDKSG